MRAPLTILLLSAFVSVAAQPVDDVVLRAMQDELQRNLQELKAPGYDKPFFIMYGLRDVRRVGITATLGAIMESKEYRGRSRSTSRVLVGDYGFNDESMEDDLTTGPTAMDLDIPITDDYDGIRRSYWSITDNVYREAARHYKDHQETLKESNKTIKDIVHREFAKSEPVRVIQQSSPYVFDKAAWEGRLRRYSALLTGIEGVGNTAVAFVFKEGYSYLVSSEGSLIKTPFRSATLGVFIEWRGTQGSAIYEQMVRSARTPDQLPGEAQMTKEILDLLNGLKAISSNEGMEEPYKGPVLYLGPAVAHSFARGLQGGREQLAATDFIPNTKGSEFEPEANDMHSRIGKLVIHESLTVKAKPRMKSYNGKELLGSFDVDPEGIVPADETTLVEKGILKNLMNNRTLTHATQKANGLGRGPGVMEITTTMKDTEAALKKKLIDQARKEGLDFAMIVRDQALMGMGPMTAYKVSVADGKETLLRNVVVREDGMRAFRRVLGASGTYAAYNMPLVNAQFSDVSDDASVSYIVPTALLLEEVEMQSMRMQRRRETEYVPNPLVKK